MRVDFGDCVSDFTVMKDGELVGEFVLKVGSNQKNGFSTELFYDTDDFTGNDLIAIGEKLNELNGVEDEN